MSSTLVPGSRPRCASAVGLQHMGLRAPAGSLIDHRHLRLSTRSSRLAAPAGFFIAMRASYHKARHAAHLLHLLSCSRKSAR